jgi:hypothetical protein
MPATARLISSRFFKPSGPGEDEDGDKSPTEEERSFFSGVW